MNSRSAGCVLALLLMGGPAQAEDSLRARAALFRSAIRMTTSPDPPSPRASIPSTVKPTGPGTCAPPSKPTASGVRLRIDAAIREASLRFAVNRRLIRSVIRHESNFDPAAVSRVGAQGLMQLMPATARTLGVGCPFDIRQNILGGTRYLRHLYDEFGDWALSLAAYNAGPSRAAAVDSWPAETRHYVKRVLVDWDPVRYGGS